MATLTFIHGILNKPAPDVLLAHWERALADGGGINLATEGVDVWMVYWADVLYPKYESLEVHESAGGTIVAGPTEGIDMAWREGLTGQEKAVVDRLAASLAFDEVAMEGGFGPAGDTGAATEATFEGLPLPEPVKKWAMGAFLRDVHHFLYNTEHTPAPGGPTYRVRDEIRRRTVMTLEKAVKGEGPHILVGHSLGAVIAYDCLKRVEECPKIDSLITIGGPLGREEIQFGLKPGWSQDYGFPSGRLGGPAGRLEGAWINVFDRLDIVVGLRAKIAGSYRHANLKLVVDLAEPSTGWWRHDVDKYLHGPVLRSKLRECLMLEGGDQ